MHISIAIPAFNEAKYLPETITTAKCASRAFAVAGWQSEIVVCDNNSTDATAEGAKAHGARVVFEPFNQIAASRNAAGRAAKGDWLVFVDADTQVSPELFREMMLAVAAGDCIGGGAPVLFDSGPWLACQTVHVWNTLAKLLGWAAGSFLFCRADAFHELDGFDPELFAAEEVDYCVRLNRLAKRLANCRGYVGHDSGVTHIASALGLPTLVLWGPSREIIWCPLGEKVLVLNFGNQLSELSVENVIDGLNSLGV